MGKQVEGKDAIEVGVNTREQEMKEPNKENLRVNRKREALVHELCALREIQRSDAHSSGERNTTEEDDRVPPPAKSCSWRSMSEVLLGPCPQGSFSLYDCSTLRLSCIAELIVSLCKEPVCQFQAFFRQVFDKQSCESSRVVGRSKNKTQKKVRVGTQETVIWVRFMIDDELFRGK